MTPRPEPQPRLRARSPFTAAFLSLLFPGLGHAYAGAFERALAFAAAPVLILALVAGIGLNLRLEFLGFLLQPPVLVATLILNFLLALYRLVAIVDAYRVADYLDRLAESGGGRYGPARRRLGVVSLAGLLAVVLVMGGGHAVVAYYDLQALDLIQGVFNPNDQALATPSPHASGRASGEPATAEPTAQLTASPTELPRWNGTDRLNILLVGVDQRPAEGTFNTDTLIVVSIDPVTHRVAMFSIPRDTVDVPLPDLPARAVYGASFGGKINSLYVAALARPDLFPGGGYAALKATLGELYGLQITYFIQVNFDGFKEVVDAVGGVTINVQVPVVDDAYPADSGRLRRVYIPAGIQHMSGAEALVYARSRHGSSDFDRGQRQQRVLLSLRQQADFGRLAARLPDLVSALKQAVKTDIPVDQLPQLLQLASTIDASGVRSYVFAPSYYATEVVNGDPRGYVILPNVDRIRSAVARAFRYSAAEEALREKVADENADVWVLNGTGIEGQASRLAAYLAFRGLNASAPNQKPDESGASTTIRVYNGAEDRLPSTLKLLSQVFKVEAVPVTDQAVKADVIVTTGADAPNLTPPPAP